MKCLQVREKEKEKTLRRREVYMGSEGVMTQKVETPAEEIAVLLEKREKRVHMIALHFG